MKKKKNEDLPWIKILNRRVWFKEVACENCRILLRKSKELSAFWNCISIKPWKTRNWQSKTSNGIIYAKSYKCALILCYKRNRQSIRKELLIRFHILSCSLRSFHLSFWIFLFSFRVRTVRIFQIASCSDVSLFLFQ